jgi:hypothetical protein
MAEIKFFGEADLHPTKHVISSEFPAWYAPRPMEQLGEEVDKMERQLDRGEIPSDKLSDFKDALRTKKEQSDRIRESIPKLGEPDKNRLDKARKDMANIIRSGYFTRSQMIKGTVDAHKEAERMVRPLIEVKPEWAEILKASRVPIVDGKVSRDGMVKAWKICGRLLNLNGGDEDTNAETLRKD